jgi:hypothetical protein
MLSFLDGVLNFHTSHLAISTSIVTAWKFPLQLLLILPCLTLIIFSVSSLTNSECQFLANITLLYSPKRL